MSNLFVGIDLGIERKENLGNLHFGKEKPWKNFAS